MRAISRLSPQLTLAAVFLRIGLTSFGGAFASMAIMEQEWVQQRKALTREQFMEGMALCYLLPGPTAVLLSIYLGSRLHGTRGGIISGMMFIAPAAILTLLFSWIYFQYHTLPAISGLFVDLGPVAVALIFAMLFRSGKTALTSLSRWTLSLVVGILLVFPVLPQAWNLVTLLLLSGLVGLFCFRKPPTMTTTIGSGAIMALSSVVSFFRDAVSALSPGLMVLLSLAFVFLKASLLMFGGGVVALPIFQHELVQTYQWLTPQQFLDGVAIGQLTPGPITVVATFAGYAVGGLLGAIVATIAIYLPSFILMLRATPLLIRLRHSTIIQGILQGIMAGAIGMMGATVFLLGQAAITNLWHILLTLVCIILLIRWNVSAVLVIVGVAFLGLLRLLFAFSF